MADERPEPWPRISAWLRVHARAVARQLRPPVKQALMTSCERAIGHPLHDALRTAYQTHDGARPRQRALFAALRVDRQRQWAHGMSWLPLGQAVNELHEMQSILDGWPDTLLPIASDGGGNHVLVDLEVGTVLLRDHEDGELVPLAPDFTTYMCWLADDMEARLVDTEGSDDDTELTLRTTALPPPPPPPVLQPDRAARVLLEVLLERRCIAVSSGSREPLITALHHALAARGPAKRVKKVVAALEASALVDEIFADDAVLMAVLEDVG